MVLRWAGPAFRGSASGEPGRPGRPSTRRLAVLSCAAVAWICAGFLEAAVERQIPEQTYLRTEPVPRLLVFTYVPKAPDADKTPVIFFSGQWGWTPLQQDAASFLASTGRLVVGIDGVNYFSDLITTKGLAQDLGRFRARANERAGRSRDAPVILAGFSSGAEIIPFVVNRAGEPGVRGAVLISPGKEGGRVFRAADRLNMVHSPEERFDVGDELRRMAPLPVALIQGTLDEEAAAKDLSRVPRGPHIYVPVVGGDHKFKEVRDILFEALSRSLLWIERSEAMAAPGPASPPAASPAPPAAPLPTASPDPTSH